MTNLFARADGDSLVVLTWTAPGDDGRSGRASRYEIRYSADDPSVAGWWDELSESLASSPSPAPAGAPEEHRVRGLAPENTYFFRLRTFDEAGNGSALSNVASADVEPPRPPSIDDLVANTVTSSWIDLGWTAPFGNSSAPTSYELRRSLSPIDEEGWEEAESIPDLPSPSPPGASESFRVRSLQASRTYYFALRTRSANGVLSELGPELVVDTPSIRLLRNSTVLEFPDLQSAVDAARDGEVIELSGGRFTGSRNRDIVVEGKSITLRGSTGTEEECRIDLEQAGHALVFQGSEGSSENGSIVQWITFANGRAGSGFPYGGAVFCSGTGPSFVSCRFQNNSAEESGGAVALTGGSSARFENCQFTDNSSNNSGGAIWVEGSAPRFVRSTFTENRAGNRGGAVAVLSGGSPIFEDRCVFRDNAAAQHGGAIAYANSGGEVRDTVFLTNQAGTAIDAGGGAVFCHNGSSPAFSQCQFEENVASKWGGAVYAWTDSSPVFSNSILVGNQAEEGGAALSFSRSLPSFDRCTLVENTAQVGGGLRAIGAESGFVLSRSILAFSSSGSSVNCQNGASVDAQCSLVFGNLPRDWDVSCLSGQLEEPGNLRADPLFCFPEIGDYRLSVESPAAATPTCGTLGAREVGCSP